MKTIPNILFFRIVWGMLMAFFPILFAKFFGGISDAWYITPLFILNAFIQGVWISLIVYYGMERHILRQVLDDLERISKQQDRRDELKGK